MQLLTSDPSYDHEDEVDRSEFLAELEDHLHGLTPEVRLRDGNIGHGADVPVIVAALTGLFFLGKDINENLDAWIELAKKFAATLKWLAAKAAFSRVDESGAKLIAIKAICDQSNSPIQSIKLVAAAHIPFWSNQLIDPESLDHHPDGLFSQTYVVNSDRVVVVVIKSNGAVESIATHPISEWYRF